MRPERKEQKEWTEKSDGEKNLRSLRSTGLYQFEGSLMYQGRDRDDLKRTRSILWGDWVLKEFVFYTDYCHDKIHQDSLFTGTFRKSCHGSCKSHGSFMTD